MKTRGTIVLTALGIAFWMLGTFWYRAKGQVVFETSSLRYWLNFAVTPLVSTLACLAIFSWLDIPAFQWSSAALLIAIPGMLGEAFLLSNFSRWMPGMRQASAGPYAGFLFATYALLLGVAETIALRAAN